MKGSQLWHQITKKLNGNKVLIWNLASVSPLVQHLCSWYDLAYFKLFSVVLLTA